MKKHKKPRSQFPATPLLLRDGRQTVHFEALFRTENQSSQIFDGVLLHSALVNMLTLDSAVCIASTVLK